MAIKISGNTVIDDSRNATNLVSVSAASSVTAASFYGDGSNLSGVATSTTFLVVGRSSNITVPVSGNTITIEGRSGNVSVPVWYQIILK